MLDRNGTEIYNDALVKIWGKHHGVIANANDEPLEPRQEIETIFMGETATVIRTLDGEICVVKYLSDAIFTFGPEHSDGLEVVRSPT